jgi:hypothetical protein
VSIPDARVVDDTPSVDASTSSLLWFGPVRAMTVNVHVPTLRSLHHETWEPSTPRKCWRRVFNHWFPSNDTGHEPLDASGAMNGLMWTTFGIVPLVSEAGETPPMLHGARHHG